MFSYVQDSPEEGGQVFTGPVLYYFVNDHLGTPQMVVDGSGQIAWEGNYLPFGEAQVVVDQVGNSIRFPGQSLMMKPGCSITGIGIIILLVDDISLLILLGWVGGIRLMELIRVR